MSKVLNVYLHEKNIGELYQDNHGDINFVYSHEWLSDPAATKISCSLPLQNEIFKRKSCHAFFGGILPEDIQRRIIAKNLGISADNDFSMLEKIGGECAGALSFFPVDNKMNNKKNHYQKISDSELFQIVQELPSRPLLAGKPGVRLSLAGVQDKLAVYVEGNHFFIPLENSPSSHVLKPDFNRFNNVIFNEQFCLNLAKTIGLSVAEAEIKKFGDINCLLVKRYDRVEEEKSKKIMRIHQEDFCQALGISSENKYQNEGGPSLKQCFDLIRRESFIPVLDLGKMLNAVIFNFLIGNCDAHGKNFSLLYLNNQLQLAPLYDLISTLYYQDLSEKMAMKIGGEYRINDVNVKHFDKLSDEIGFSKPEVRKSIRELIDMIIVSLPRIEQLNQTQEEVAELIKRRCERFLLQAKNF